MLVHRVEGAGRDQETKNRHKDAWRTGKKRSRRVAQRPEENLNCKGSESGDTKKDNNKVWTAQGRGESTSLHKKHPRRDRNTPRALGPHLYNRAKKRVGGKWPTQESLTSEPQAELHVENGKSRRRSKRRRKNKKQQARLLMRRSSLTGLSETTTINYSEKREINWREKEPG